MEVVESAETTFPIQTENNSLLFAGQEAVYNAQGDGYSSYVLREGTPEDDQGPVRTLDTGNDNLITINTETLDTGSYYITGNGNNVLEFEVIQQDFGVSFTDDTVGNAGDSAETTFEVSSDNRAEEFDINVSEDGNDIGDDALLDIFNASGDINAVDVDVDDDGDTEDDGIQLQNVEDGDEIDAVFDGVDPDEYNFTATVVDTGVEGSAAIEVTESADGALSFNDSTLEEERGDIATINATFNNQADQGTLVIGSEEQSGYQANILLEDGNDDGSVAVEFNTYTAGMNVDASNIVSAVDDDDSATLMNVENQSEYINSMLEATDDGYQLAVQAGGDTNFDDTLENPDELGTLFLTERNTSGINAWTAPNGEYSEIEDASDVTTAVENGVITETDEIAEGDVAIFQIEASGITGIIENNSNSILGVGGDDLNFSLEEADDRPNQPERTVGLTGDNVNSKVITNDSNQVFLLVDTPNDGLNWENGDDIADGTSLTANFTVQDNRLIGSNDVDDHQTVETTFENVAPSAEFDEDPLEVPASANAVISGSTNIAPGSEITVRVSSTDSEARFIKTNESVTVSPNGTFEAMFDFTEDATVGDEFEASIRNYGASGDEVTVTGTVVEANNTTTTTGNGTNMTDTTTGNMTDTTTGDGETTTDDGETTTGDGATTTGDGGPGGETTTTGTPGFTAVLAVIALIGAALVAIRRDN